MGHAYALPNVKMQLAESIKRRDTERKEWLPITITDTGTLKHIEYHGSGHIDALRTADGLVCMDVGVAEIPKGTVVRVMLI
jgi:molybdopterin biosynthesis enzyme